MNNEIKEILEDIKRIQKSDYDKLLDYITDLQEENKRLKEIIKDNTILVKDENGNYQECNINPLDYKSRNEKAIEFIEEELTFYITIGGTDERKLIGYNKAFDELLKILKGSDKE